MVAITAISIASSVAVAALLVLAMFIQTFFAQVVRLVNGPFLLLLCLGVC